MASPSHNRDIRNEPALNASTAASGGDDETKADRLLSREASQGGNTRDAAKRSVFDEPFGVTRSDDPPVIQRNTVCPQCGYNLRGGLAGAPCPECGHRFDCGYAQWLEAHFASASKATGYVVVFAILLISGVMAIAGTLVGSAMSMVGTWIG